MKKKYLTKIIANDQEGLQMISACMAGAKAKISNMKYIKSNKKYLEVIFVLFLICYLIFLFFLSRY